MDEEQKSAPVQISWLRAIATTVVIVAVAVGVLVYGSNAVLTDIHGKTRNSLVAIVTTLFFVVLIAMAWVLRRLQGRKII